MTEPATLPPQIFERLVRVLQAVKAIGKDQTSDLHNFKFRGIDDLQNQLNPLFSEFGVFLVPEVLERERVERPKSGGGVLAFTTIRVRYHFYAEDGSSVSAVVDGEGMDSGDKSTTKALTAALKALLNQTFLIPTEDLVDPDADNPEPDKAGQGTAGDDNKKELMTEIHELGKGLGYQDAEIKKTILDAKTIRGLEGVKAAWTKKKKEHDEMAGGNSVGGQSDQK